jgi:hypothetical protein
MNGPIRFAAALVTIALAGGCASPTTPATPAPTTPTSFTGPFNGVWQVDGTVTFCGGNRQCWTQYGKTVATTLRLSHIGETVEGSAIIGDKIFEVRGQAAGAELRLTGTQRFGGNCIGDATLTEFVLTTGDAAPQGQFRWVSPRPSTCPNYDYQTGQEARLVTATRVSDQTVVASYTGSWSGSATTEACSPQDVVKVCYSNTGCVDEALRPLTVVCETGSARPVGIGLTQNGQTVSGTLANIPVTGTVVDGRVIVSGSYTRYLESLEPGTHIQTITDATLVMDHLGRMSGTYRIDREYRPKNGNPAYHWSQYEHLDHVVIR